MSASDALPAHLVHLCTLVLVSRASASASAASTHSHGAPSLGFTHARSQPLDTLAHLLSSYLHLAASTAASAANLAGRDHAAPWDVAHALAQLGFAGQAGLDELTEEAERGHDGVEEEAQQIAQLAKGLQERLAPQPAKLPLCQLAYDPLQPSEIELVALAQSLPTDDAPTPSGSSAASSTSDDDLASPPPLPAAGPALEAKPESFLALNGFGSVDDLCGLLTGQGADDAAFFDSLGVGGSAPGGSGRGGVNGIGDITASVFQPLDLVGRPIGELSLLGPADLAALPMFPTGAEGAAPPPEDETRPFPAWRDPSAIPPHVPPFFPPFPGHERESDSAAARRRRRAQAEQREREALAAQTGAGGATVGRAAAALMLGGGAGGDPWEEAIPYSASSLATMASEFGHSLPTPSSPRARDARALRNESGEGDEAAREKKRRRAEGRRRSLSPPPTASTSLASFAQIQPLLKHEKTFLRANALRRSAAGHIAYTPRHPELSISSDSLFGSLPYAAPLRQSTLPPGFLPDLAPTAALHPFNTNLPWTISNPVPYHPASTSSILPAPPPDPRVPAPMSAIARELAFPLQFDPRPQHRDQLHPNIALFARLRRIGPPGPLGPKGEALNYEYQGNTALLALSGVDWPERRHDRKLPKRFGEDDSFSTGAGGSGTGAGGPGGGGGGGIKLKLGGGGAGRDAFAAAAGRQTREPSLAAIGTPWNTFGSPAPFPSSTPGPTAFVGGSTGDAELDTQLAELSASLPGAAAVEQPQVDFDYPEWLLEAGGLTSAAPVAESAPAPAREWAMQTEPAPPAPPAPEPQPEVGQADDAALLDPALAGESAPNAPAVDLALQPALTGEGGPSDPGAAALDPALADADADASMMDAAAPARGHDEHGEVDVESAVQKGIEAALFGGMGMGMGMGFGGGGVLDGEGGAEGQ